MVRTRFAPSPTGLVHIGSIRTALFCYLLAKQQGGSFILRVEDTDQTRLVEEALGSLLRVMKQLGIQPDEGYFLDDKDTLQERGEFGPYLQSQRLDIYKKYIQELLNNKSAYYCYCSSQRLEELRKEQTALKQPPMYDRHCRNLSEQEKLKAIEACKSEGREPVIRLAIPQEGTTVVHDLIYGEIKYENALLDDQILIKSDGFPTYHFAVVVDDHLMQISHIIRTDEWLPSTPKHVLLYKAFGWEAPFFAHAPLILNTDKTKMSKRKGDVSAESFLNKGYLPEAIINFIALLGWNPKTEQEIFSMEELIQQFDLSKINKAGAVFDVNKLDWMNGKYIREMDDVELTKKLIPYWERVGWIEEVQSGKWKLQSLDGKQVSFDYLVEITKVEKERLKKLSDITESTDFYFKRPELNKEILAWKKSTLEDAMQKLAELKEFFGTLTEEAFLRYNIEKSLQDFIAEKGYDNGSVLWPLRVALTGLAKSTGPFDVISVIAQGLGREEIIKRLSV